MNRYLAFRAPCAEELQKVDELFVLSDDVTSGAPSRFLVIRFCVTRAAAAVELTFEASRRAAAAIEISHSEEREQI